ncbi:hypothetical protein EVAR_22356_1 [Eumeta japonica]|uniref:Uncharacterized protein n=1 Tax=Eumeta variegata TaxID=151549 RepID=A0A4C1VK83_EUMVA|nr:hypothetical protein EVAR_22356_1 [Eumeta japonica]
MVLVVLERNRPGRGNFKIHGGVSLGRVSIWRQFQVPIYACGWPVVLLNRVFKTRLSHMDRGCQKNQSSSSAAVKWKEHECGWRSSITYPTVIITKNDLDTANGEKAMLVFC